MDYALVWGSAGSICMSLGVWLIWSTLTRPRGARRAQFVEVETVRVQYEQSRLLLPWSRFLTQGGLYGVVFALLTYVGVLNPVVIVPAFVFGFVYLYCGEEDRRDRLTMRYNSDLVQAASFIIDAYQAKPSTKEAIRTASVYSTGTLQADLEGLISDREANIPWNQALVRIAEKRDSLFLDGFLETLKAADKMKPVDIARVLADQSVVIKEGMRAFLQHLIDVESTRREVGWAVFGPWIIAAAARWLPTLAGSNQPIAEFGAFYASPLGTLFLLGASVLTNYAYWSMTRTMRSGIVLGRIRPRKRS